MPKTEDKSAAPIPGIAIAGMFFVWALLFFASASYFNANTDGRIAWYVVGAVTAVIAFVGALTELANVPGREALRDFGSTLLLAAITAGLGIPPVIWVIPGPINGLLKGGALAFALITALGFSAGVGRLTSSEARAARTRSQRSRSDTALTLVIGVLALVTAGLNLWAAIAAKH